MGVEALPFLSEAALVEAARELNEVAWEEIYHRHAGRVYSYLYFRIRDQHVAEDLTADVFVRALAGIERYVWRGTPLLAWLYRIAHNVAADYRQKAARHSLRVVWEPPGGIEDPRDLAKEIDAHTDMLNALRSLTDEQQQVIVLRFYHGMSNADVARIVGKREGAVKALQSRALRSLRRVFAGAEEGLRSA